MKYVIYFAVATPLLLGWLFYESQTLPPQPPLFASGYERISTQPAQELAAAPVATPADKTANPAPKKLAKNETSAAD